MTVGVSGQIYRAVLAAQKSLIKAVQTELKNLGLYTGEIDGLAGPKTWDAIAQALKPEDPLTIRQLLIRQQRQLNRIEKLVGSKRDGRVLICPKGRFSDERGSIDRLGGGAA